MKKFFIAILSALLTIMVFSTSVIADGDGEPRFVIKEINHESSPPEYKGVFNETNCFGINQNNTYQFFYDGTAFDPTTISSENLENCTIEVATYTEDQETKNCMFAGLNEYRIVVKEDCGGGSIKYNGERIGFQLGEQDSDDYTNLVTNQDEVMIEVFDRTDGFGECNISCEDVSADYPKIATSNNKTKYVIKKVEVEKYSFTFSGKNDGKISWIRFNNTSYSPNQGDIEHGATPISESGIVYDQTNDVYTLSLSNCSFDNDVYTSIEYSYHNEGGQDQNFEPQIRICGDGFDIFPYKNDENTLYVSTNFVRTLSDEERNAFFNAVTNARDDSVKTIIARVNILNRKGEEKIRIFEDGYYYTEDKYINFELFNATGVDVTKAENFGAFNRLSLGNGQKAIISVLCSEYSNKQEAESNINKEEVETKIYQTTRNADREEIVSETEKIVFKSSHKAIEYDRHGAIINNIEVSAPGSFVFLRRENPHNTMGSSSEASQYQESLVIDKIFGDGSLTYWVEELLHTAGKKITLKENTAFTLNEDLILRNYGSFREECSYSIRNTDLWIDLNGSTLDLGNNSIYIEGYSMIHIINGTIKGTSKSLINNYGTLVLINVKVNNTSENIDCACITDMGTMLYMDLDCSLTSSGDGIRYRETNDLYDLNENEQHHYLMWLQSDIEAKKSALDLRNHDPKKRVVEVFYGGNFDQNYNLANSNKFASVNSGFVDINISGDEYGIYNDGVASIVLVGEHCSDDKKIVTNVKGSVAIATAGSVCGNNKGELKIEVLTSIESTGEDKPCIEILNSDLNNISQTINIWTDESTNFSSKGVLIKDNSKNANSISIKSRGNIYDSRFDYVGKLIDTGTKLTDTISVSAGIYKTNILNEYVDSNNKQIVADITKYKTASITIPASSRYHEFVGYKLIAINEPEVVSISSTTSIDDIKSYFENTGTKTINLTSDITLSNEEICTIYTTKVLRLNGHNITGLRFIENMNDGTDEFTIEGKGTISTNEDTILILSGHLNEREDRIISTNGTAIVIENGWLEQQHLSSLTGKNEAVKIDVINPNNYGRAIIRGTLTGTNGISSKIVKSGNSNEDGINLEYIIDKDNDNKLCAATLNGAIIIEDDSKLVMQEGTINVDADDNNGVAIQALNGANIIAYQASVNATTSSFKLGGDCLVDIYGGTYTGKDIIDVVYDGENNPHLNIGSTCFANSARFKTNDKENGSVLAITDGNGTTVNHVDAYGRTILNDCRVTGGFFNVKIDKSQFKNIDDVVNQGKANQGHYGLIQYLSLTNDYPYTIDYILDSASSYLVYDSTRGVPTSGYYCGFSTGGDINSVTDEESLNQIVDEKEIKDGVYGTLVIKDGYVVNYQSLFTGKEIKELYEIFINKIYPDGTTEEIRNAKSYQVIKLTVSDLIDMGVIYGDPDNIVVYHAHNGNAATPMKKVSKANGNKMLEGTLDKEECYFNSGNDKITVITKRFSQFGLAKADDKVEEEEPYKAVITSGEDIIFNTDTSTKYQITIDYDYNLFESIEIKGISLVKDVDYVVTKGSTIITFTESGLNKLKTLSNGEYDVKVNFTDGKVVTTKLTISGTSTPSPETKYPTAVGKIVPNTCTK